MFEFDLEEMKKYIEESGLKQFLKNWNIGAHIESDFARKAQMRNRGIRNNLLGTGSKY